MPATAKDAAVIAFRDVAAFEAWLDEHVDLRAGVWLKLAKKRSGVPSRAQEAVFFGHWARGLWPPLRGAERSAPGGRRVRSAG